MELKIHAAECQCPMKYWVPKIKNFALSIKRKNHLPRHIGKKYNAENFLEVLLLHTMLNMSIDESSDFLNTEAWLTYNLHRRRKRKPIPFNGIVPRKERLVPNGDQIRNYRNKIPVWFTKRLNDEIFDLQLNYAYENGLIDRNLTIIVGDNDEWYYGSDRYPKNQYNNKSNKGSGTSRK